MPRNKKLSAPMVMRFPVHKSPIDGSMIESPEQRREHNKRHSVIDLGNDRTPVVEGPKPRSVRDDLVENLKKLESK